MSDGGATSSGDVASKARQQFQTETRKPYVDWYWRDLNRLHRAYIRCFWIGLVCGFMATVLAALPKEVSGHFAKNGSEIVGWLVVMFSALATLTTSTLTPRYKRMLDDRDKGRIRLGALADKLKVQNYPSEVRQELLDAIDEIAAVEGSLGLERDKDDKSPGGS